MHCTVCAHPQRRRIEILKTAGASLDELARRFNLSRDAIHRHWRRHVSEGTKAGYCAGPVALERRFEKALDDGGNAQDYLGLARSLIVELLIAAAARNVGAGARADAETYEPPENANGSKTLTS